MAKKGKKKKANADVYQNMTLKRKRKNYLSSKERKKKKRRSGLE